MAAAAYEGWAIVELMGHVRMAGQVREVEAYGTKMLQLDVPELEDVDLKAFTTFVAGHSLYRVTPTTEVIAKGVVRAARPRPVQPYDVDLGAKKLGAVQDAETVDGDDDTEDGEGPNRGY
jgi:hypothetical protein